MFPFPSIRSIITDKMPKQVHITVPPPTEEEWERFFGIPEDRKKELQRLVDEFRATHGRCEQASQIGIAMQEDSESA